MRCFSTSRRGPKAHTSALHARRRLNRLDVLITTGLEPRLEAGKHNGWGSVAMDQPARGAVRPGRRGRDAHPTSHHIPYCNSHARQRALPATTCCAALEERLVFQKDRRAGLCTSAHRPKPRRPCSDSLCLSPSSALVISPVAPISPACRQHVGLQTLLSSPIIANAPRCSCGEIHCSASRVQGREQRDWAARRENRRRHANHIAASSDIALLLVHALHSCSKSLPVTIQSCCTGTARLAQGCVRLQAVAVAQCSLTSNRSLDAPSPRRITAAKGKRRKLLQGRPGLTSIPIAIPFQAGQGGPLFLNGLVDLHQPTGRGATGVVDTACARHDSWPPHFQVMSMADQPKSQPELCPPVVHVQMRPRPLSSLPASGLDHRLLCGVLSS